MTTILTNCFKQHIGLFRKWIERIMLFSASVRNNKAKKC